MGGEHSGVSASTRSIFLESAFFDTIALAGKARSYGLHTDASHRYERVSTRNFRGRRWSARPACCSISLAKAGPIVEAQRAIFQILHL